MVDSATEPEGIPGGEFGATWRVASIARRVVAAVAVATAACAVGVTLGRRLPAITWPGLALDGSATKTAAMMAALVGLTGLLAGVVSGLLVGGRRPVAALLAHGLTWAAVGAVAGGLGPILEALAAGRLPATVATVIACSIAGLLAALPGHPRRRAEPAATPENDGNGETGEPPPAPAIGRIPNVGSVVRQWPILSVSALCLAVIVVAPPSPAGWPLLAVAFLGFAVAWTQAAQNHRMRALQERLREQGAGAELNAAPVNEGNPDDTVHSR